MSNICAALLNQMSSGIIASLKVIDNDLCAFAVFKNTIEENNGNIAGMKLLEMRQVFCIERKRSDNAIYPLVKKIVCIGNLQFRCLCRVRDNKVVFGLCGYTFNTSQYRSNKIAV